MRVVVGSLIAVYTTLCCALPFKRYFSEAYLRPLLVLAALAAIALAVRYSLPLEGNALLAVAAVTLGTAWQGFAGGLGFADQDRLAFSEMFGRLLVRRSEPKTQTVRAERYGRS